MIAIIPARVGSQGIEQKNWQPLDGQSPINRAIDCAKSAGIYIVVTTDAPIVAQKRGKDYTWLYAQAPLHTDTCPMIDVVKDVLARVPGESEEIVVLLQPTQPLRRPEDVLQAIFMLEDDPALDSVFSVIPVPSSYHADVQIIPGRDTRPFPNRRQDLGPAFVRDGTVYAFRRKTVDTFGTIYGQKARFFAIDPQNSCFLDTPADWREAERRIRAKLDVATAP